MQEKKDQNQRIATPLIVRLFIFVTVISYLVNIFVIVQGRDGVTLPLEITWWRSKSPYVWEVVMRFKVISVMKPINLSGYGSFWMAFSWLLLS